MSFTLFGIIGWKFGIPLGTGAHHLRSSTPLLTARTGSREIFLIPYVTSRQHHVTRPRTLGLMASTPRFLQGVFSFSGAGLDKPELIDPTMKYVIPAGSIAQPLYASAALVDEGVELIVVTLLRDGESMRVFPIGQPASIPVRVVETTRLVRLELVVSKHLVGTAGRRRLRSGGNLVKLTRCRQRHGGCPDRREILTRDHDSSRSP